MDSPKSPPGSVRRHRRNISHPLPRRNTRGPLDVADDPLAEPSSSPSVQPGPPVDLGEPHEVPQFAGSDAASDGPDPALPPINLSFLQARDIYHKLPTDSHPAHFQNALNRPPRDTSLSHLLQQGHYRRAADLTLKDLLQASPSSATQIFQLLYTRLACLILISRPDLAAEEAVQLTEYLARHPPGAEDVLPQVPWELRLLLVRLQAIGAADGGRRGIMALYALAGETRANLRRARIADDGGETSLWTTRLEDLGLRVCDALVEMGELETAQRHLDTLPPQCDPGERLYRKALLRLRVGDVVGAQQLAALLSSPSQRVILQTLLDVLEGTASTSLSPRTTEISAHNAALAFVYANDLPAARARLEELFDDASNPLFPTLLFNLSTLYELCTERARDLKLGLAVRAAGREGRAESGGWERGMVEFKL